jgi:hypothetical protein
VDTPAAADFLGVSPAFLEKDRITGEHGIPYVKLGRKVLYDITDLNQLMAQKKRLNTSETAAP